jgi:hypothetical protein
MEAFFIPVDVGGNVREMFKLYAEVRYPFYFLTETL